MASFQEEGDRIDELAQTLPILNVMGTEGPLDTPETTPLDQRDMVEEEEGVGIDEAPSFLDEMFAAAMKAEEEKQEKQKANNNKSATKQSSGSFSKGFLNSSSAKKKARKKKKKTKTKGKLGNPEPSSLATITASSSNNASTAKEKDLSNTLVLEEVQESLRRQEEERKASFTVSEAISGGEWLTPELTQAIQNNPTLLEGFQHPGFQRVMSLMASAPQEAMELVRQDARLQSYFQAFNEVMASHFTQLGEKEEKEKKEEKDAEVEEVLSNEEVRAILMEEGMQRKLQACQENPSLLHRWMREDESFRRKLKVLQSAGLIRFES